MALNEYIYIGSVESPTFSFNAEQIESIVCNNAVDIVGNELSADALEVGVFYDDDEALQSIKYATPIFYYSGESFVGKYYITQVERRGMTRFTFHCTSLIGLTDRENFYGGMYSGEHLSDVFYSIMLSDGVSPIYTVYHAKNNGQGQGVLVTSKAASVTQWNYRTHLEFTVSDFIWDVSEYTDSTDSTQVIAGHDGYYYVAVMGHRESTAVTNGWYNLYIVCNGFSQNIWAENGVIGNGSSFIVDIDPIKETVTAEVNYISYLDPSITGKFVFQDGIQVFYPSSNSIQLCTAFGFKTRYTNRQYYYAKLIWAKHQVYDENGRLIMDAVLGKRDSDATNYVVNGVDGNGVASSLLETSGSSLGRFGGAGTYSRMNDIWDSFEFNAGIANLPVYGWIPVGTRRNAIHQLMFSQNVSMIKGGNGKTMFTGLVNSVSDEISDDDLYDSGTEKDGDIAKTIHVTEHGYSNSGLTSQVLFDNTDGAAMSGEYIVQFQSAPVYGTPVGSGITIISYNCNAARVSGRGTITGTPYVHYQNDITWLNDGVDGADVSVSDIGLITNVNSDSVMDKMKRYYGGSVKKITNGIVYGGEVCGRYYAFKSPFGKSVEAFLTKYAAKTSSFLKLDSEFVSGYISPAVGGYSSRSLILPNQSGDTYWDIPDEAKQTSTHSIRLNMIGDGETGSVGQNGADGSDSGGAGGSGGTGGNGGKVLSVTIDVANAAKLRFSRVTGTLGYKVDVLAAGSQTIATYSTENGVRMDSGFVDLFTGEIFARKGMKGTDGANGGKGAYFEGSNYNKFKKPEYGQDCGLNKGGATTFAEHGEDYSTVTDFTSYFTGNGGGGGASATKNGSDAAFAKKFLMGHDVYVGNGGNGAGGGTPPAFYPEYGSGGTGGCGGGGGGGWATVLIYHAQGAQESWSSDHGSGGRGGGGGAGTRGIRGCAIIYY